MPNYTPWTWSEPHRRHYSYLIADDGATILDTLWSGPSGGVGSAANPPVQAINTIPRTGSQVPSVAQLSSTPIPPHGSPPGNYVAMATVSNQYPTTQPPSHLSPLQERYRSTESGFDEDDEDTHNKGKERKEIHLRSDSGTAPPIQSLGASQIRSPYSGIPSQASSTNNLYTNLPNSQYGSNSHASSSRSHNTYSIDTRSAPAAHSSEVRPTVASLPADVQANLGYKDRRFIQTGTDQNNTEHLDSRYRRVAKPHHSYFFVPGRVFKMLWIEPAGQANPGRTRNSTHFSTVWCGEQAYSEIRRFVVVRNKGIFSQCIPVQTYKGRGATKPGLVMLDHGVIHTSPQAPNLIPGENLTKYSIRVEPTGTETLEAESRVNYGKAYAVEHNVKVLDIGMVVEGHRYLIETYFDSAMRGQ